MLLLSAPNFKVISWRIQKPVFRIQLEFLYDTDSDIVSSEIGIIRHFIEKPLRPLRKPLLPLR